MIADEILRSKQHAFILTNIKCQKYMHWVQLPLHMLLQSLPLSTFLRDTGTLVSEEHPKPFPWQHFLKYSRYRLSFKMPLWSKICFLQPDLLEKGTFLGESRSYCCIQIHAIGIFDFCILTLKAFQSSILLIMSWNSLELRRWNCIREQLSVAL